MSARVSIIVPVFNGARYLSAAIESALQQTWPEKEIIVVDDGSADDSLTLARGYETRGVRVFAQANGGASAARNRGLAEATGELIQFLDADDILAPDKIAVQIDQLAQTPDTLASGVWGVFSDQIETARFTREGTYESANSIEWLVNAWTSGAMMHPGAWLTPRTLIERAGPWNETLSLDDDGEYFARVILAGRGVRFVPNAKVFYRRHGGVRLSATRGERAWKSSLRSCELKETILLAAENSARTRRAAASNYARYAWENYPEGGDYVSRSILRWQELDPTVRPPSGGRREAWLARWLGWRFARRLQKRQWRSSRPPAR